jgi:hypothetical protein
MKTSVTRSIYVATGYGRDMDAWPVTFSVLLTYDYDHGYEAEATWKSAYIHNLPVTRDTAILIAGEYEIDRVEREIAEDVATNWRDFVRVEAAE